MQLLEKKPDTSWELYIREKSKTGLDIYPLNFCLTDA